MTSVGVCSVKHSPGATTLAVALAAAWSADPAHPPAVVVEADPAGGDLAARLGIAREPGLSSLAASARHPGSVLDPVAHAQALYAGGWVVPAPTSPEAAEAAVRALAARLAASFTGASLGVVDCGRWAPGSVVDPVLASADVALVVLRPDVAGIDHLCARLEALRRLAGERMALVLVGDRPYDAAAVAAVTGCRAVTSVAFDAAGAAGLSGAGRSAALRRSPLVRSARTLLDSLAAEGVPA